MNMPLPHAPLQRLNEQLSAAQHAARVGRQLQRAFGAHGQVQAGDGQGRCHHAFSTRTSTPSAT